MEITTQTSEDSKRPTITASLDSSNLKEAKYDPFMKVLTLTFHTGGSYDYIDVGEDVFVDLTSAESAGSFFHSRIKGKFEFLKLP